MSLFVRRLGAYLLDIAGLFAVLGPAGYAVQAALGIAPSSPHEVYVALVLTFSIPVWTYFALSDRRSGATLGKRALGVRATSDGGGPMTGAQALGRTAVKMVPWELTHVSAFLLAPEFGELSALSWTGIGLAYALTFAYGVVTWRTGGRRSVHDWAASTAVQRVEARAR